ncbi:PEP/pyruvate-binding domain-containing protein [Chloroflexi bacterium TSY]|nr:PEP/pyruvate-binding domain-containing protein [Chloroflexi bacterium TSY]
MTQNNLLDKRKSTPIRRTYVDYLAQLHKDPEFRNNPSIRATRLATLRETMRDGGEIPPFLVRQLADRITSIFGPDVMVRFRSSSNAEDGLEFNGAGLYDSTSVCALDSLDDDKKGPSHCDPSQPKERTIERALRKVWASLWNFRAWEERDYYGIDHEAVGMAILVTPAFPNERANGVAFTGDPTASDPTNDASANYLINVQVGDVSVVLPESGVLPERDQLTVVGGEVVQIQRLRSSSIVPTGGGVLADSELEELGRILALVDSKFPIETGIHQRDDILLDLEFKIRRPDNQLIFKQIRPFLKQEPQLPGSTNGLRVHVPHPLQLCGMWREGSTLQQELAEKVTLELLSGNLEIAFDTPKRTHDLFGPLHFGPTLAASQATVPGEVTIEQQGDSSTGQISLLRTYQLEGRQIEIELTFFNVQSGEFDLRRLDEVSLTQQFRVTGLLRDRSNQQILSRFHLAPCGYLQLPLIQFDIQLESEQNQVGRLLLQQRRERNDGVTGQAALVHAEVALPKGNATIDSYKNLVYSADRHHWNERFLIVLDQPLGVIYAVKVNQHFTGVGEPTYVVQALNKEFNPVQMFDVLSVVRSPVDEAFR